MHTRLETYECTERIHAKHASMHACVVEHAQFNRVYAIKVDSYYMTCTGNDEAEYYAVRNNEAAVHLLRVRDTATIGIKQS